MPDFMLRQAQDERLHEWGELKIRRYFSVAVVLLVMLLSPEVCASSSFARIRQGAPFLSARKIVIGEGWKPFDINASLHRKLQCYGADCELRRAGIVEVELCTMDSAVCYFHYRKGRKCLQVMTQNERVADLVVSDWSDSCKPALPANHDD